VGDLGLAQRQWGNCEAIQKGISFSAGASVKCLGPSRKKRETILREGKVGVTDYRKK